MADKKLNNHDLKYSEEYKKPFDPEAVLEVRHLRKCFPIAKSFTGKVLSELVAVDDISFTLKPGETLGIVGESGCGKTTMGRTILKLHPSSGGQIIFDGQDITKTPCHKIVQLGMTQVPEGRRIFQELSVYDNLIETVNKM